MELSVIQLINQMFELALSIGLGIVIIFILSMIFDFVVSKVLTRHEKVKRNEEKVKGYVVRKQAILFANQKQFYSDQQFHSIPAYLVEFFIEGEEFMTINSQTLFNEVEISDLVELHIINYDHFTHRFFETSRYSSVELKSFNKIK